MLLREGDPRRTVTDFFSVATLLHSRDWRPEDSVRFHLVADTGQVRAMLTATAWEIECGDPWGDNRGVKISVPRTATYGMVTHMMEHMRMLAELKFKGE